MAFRTWPVGSIAIVLAVLLAACGDSERVVIVGSGTLATEERTVQAFTRVEVSGLFELQITVSAPLAFSITADDNILPLITTGVEAGKLTIGATEQYMPGARTPLVTISMPDLAGFAAGGSVTAKAVDIRAEEFTVVTVGSVSFEAAGEAPRVVINASGSSELRMFGLTAREVVLDVSGAGVVEVFASEAVLGDVSGAARIVYDGSPPTVAVSVAGTGAVEAR